MSIRDEIWRLLEEAQGQIAAEIRVMLNEPAIPPANFTTENQRRRIESMKVCAASKSDEERHNDWITKHLAEGWTYGDTFDSGLKTHPNLVPWEQLPRAVKSKARIFDICAKAAARVEALLPTECTLGSVASD